jgi:diphosphate--fructose-6-phosphate 1-phosphotransferase
MFEPLMKICLKHNITGIIMVGATHTLSDAGLLTEYFLSEKVDVRVVAVPSTLDGNIRHNFF